MGLYACMGRLIPDADYVKAIDQLEDFKLRKGLFGMRAALLRYQTRSLGKCIIDVI